MPVWEAVLYRLARYRPAALLALCGLLLSAFATAPPPCETDVPGPCEEPMAEHHGAMMDEGAGMAMHPQAPPADEAPTPQPSAGMPCCTLVATTAPRTHTPSALLAITLIAAPTLALPPARQVVPAPETSPPGRPIPLHIALGRFLT